MADSGTEGWLADNPWIFVAGGVGVGVLCGLLVAALRWWRDRRSAPRVAPAAAAHSEERRWECIEFSEAVWRTCTCRKLQQNTELLVEKASLRMPLTKVAIVVTLVLSTIGCDATCFAFTRRVHKAMVEMRLNSRGDPEKIAMDSCMRDFEGLPPEAPAYVAQHRVCLAELAASEEFKRLPRIRPTTDEGICEPSNLCTKGDPGQCLDSGDMPGSVSACYALIDQAKAERDSTAKARLLDQVERACTGKGAWSKYEHEVELNYCMWKHSEVGVCTNSMRTNCPRDTSCCPIAQKQLDGGSTGTVRVDQYVCQKSPIAGLYCQHWAFREEGNVTGGSAAPLCTDVTCPSFGWCRDLADIPGECLGEACMVYERCLEMLVGSMAALVLAFVLQTAYAVLLVVANGRSALKSGLHGMSAALKLLLYLFCLASGVEDFVALAAVNRCWTEEGNAQVSKAQGDVRVALLTAISGAVGSLVLSLLSVRWNSRLASLPYAKSRPTHLQ